MSTTPILLITEIVASQNNKSTTANTAFEELEAAFSSMLAKTLTEASPPGDFTLTDPTEAARYFYYKFSGTLTGARNVIVPTRTRFYLIENATSGGYAITVKTSGGTGVSVANGVRQLLQCDATNVVAVSSGAGAGG